MQGNTSTPWWAATRRITASILASYARLPLSLNPAARTIVRPQKHAEPAQAAAAPNPISGATPMGKIRAIASTLANVLLAVAEEIGRHRRRERHFRHLSRRQGQLPLISSKVSFLRPVRVSFFR